MIDYIPVSMVSAVAGRHKYIPWKQAICNLLMAYFPDIWQQINKHDVKDIKETITTDPVKLEEYKQIVTDKIKINEVKTLNRDECQVAVIDRGVLMEEDTIGRLMSSKRMKKLYDVFKINRQVSVSAIFNTGLDNEYRISGIIDGIIWNKCIIEIKNRIRPINGEPVHDLDQLRLYMVLFGIPLPGRLIQQYAGEIVIGDELAFQDAKNIWQNEIRPALERHLAIANKHIKNENYSWFQED